MCEGHRSCTIHPVYQVSVHRIDLCNRPPGTDATYRLCSACTRAAAYRLGEMIGGAYEAMPESQAGEVLRCKCCQLLIHDLSDVFAVEWVARSA